MKTLLTLLTFMLNASVLYAQLNIGQQNNNPVTPTWDQYEFMKYGKIGATLYTGTLSYSIPIFTYKDKDFDIPISVNYSTNGYRVNHKSGLLGHGWSLSAGGMITREVKGIPDEELFSVSSASGYGVSGTLYHGYLSLPCNSREIKVLPVVGGGNYLYTNPLDKSTGHNIMVETEPDIYSFSFAGYTGCFEANADCNSNGYSLFNVSGESRGLKIKKVDNEQIKMVDVSGRIYTFSSVCKVRRKDVGIPPNDDMADMESITTGWHLSHIEAPNGRTVSYSISPVYGDYTYTVASSYYQSNTRIGSADESGKQEKIDLLHPCTGYRIDSIMFGRSAKVVFLYENGAKEYAVSVKGTPVQALGDSSRLVEILIYKYGHLVKNFRFEYLVTSRDDKYSNTVSFLKSVCVSGDGTYLFEYNTSVRAPLLGTTRFDHWGYYNDSHSTPFDGFSLFGIEEDSETYEEKGADKFKTPNFDTAVFGTLKKIVYPTGGNSSIFYEPHTYSVQVARTMRSNYYPQIQHLEENRITGGVRVKKIITCANTEGVASDTVEYSYTDRERPECSSGVLTDTPRYGVRYIATLFYTGKHGIVKNSKEVLYYSANKRLFDYGSTHIEYAHVAEKRTGKGCTDYYYTTSNLYPDNIDQTFYYSQNGIDIPTYIWDGDVIAGSATFNASSQQLANILSPVCSQQYKRGRLYRKEYRMSDGTLQKVNETEYEYPLVRTDTLPHIIGERATWFMYQRHNMNIAETNTTYFSADTALTENEKFIYNKNGLVCSRIKRESDEAAIYTNTVYVGDDTSTAFVQSQMVENNVVNAKLKELVYRMKDGRKNLVQGTRYEYCQPNDKRKALACISKTEKLKTDNTWGLVSSYKYDVLGNMIEYTDAAGNMTSLLWGWDSRYLLAKVSACTFSTLAEKLNVVGISPTYELASSTAISDETFCKLQTLYKALPEAYISLYNYRPEYGLSALVAPNTLESSFEYDGYGRLQNIRNNAGKKVNGYEYNTVSVKPLQVYVTASDSSLFATDSILFKTGVSGGNGHYKYVWTVRDVNGNIVARQKSEVPSLRICLQKAGSYNLTCDVTDCISGEGCSTDITFSLKYKPLYFTNIFEYNQLDDGLAVAGAIVNVNVPTTVTFLFSCNTAESCVLKIGNDNYCYSGRHDNIPIRVPLLQNINVSMEITDPTETSTATLIIKDAENIPVGDACTISLSMRYAAKYREFDESHRTSVGLR